VTALCSQWIACSPGRNGGRGLPLNRIVRQHLMSAERIDAMIRLFTTAEGGFARVPNFDGEFRTILTAGASRAICQLVAGEMELGHERLTSWMLIAPIEQLTPNEIVEIHGGAKGPNFEAADFERFAEGARILISDGFAIVGGGTIHRRYRLDHSENAV
jgi:hypothetical protein